MNIEREPLNIEVREIQQQAILNARANLAIKTHRTGYTFSMLDGTHEDGVVYPSRTDAETAGIQWIALHRADLIGTGELI